MKKVAVIGLGSIAQRHRKNLKQLFPSVHIIAMSASGQIKSQNIEYADFVVTSIEELIQENLDMSIVASPASLHAQHAVALLKEGIPTLIEKPVSVNLADAKIISDTANTYKTPVAVGYCLRYLSSSIKIKKLLDGDVIGVVYNASVNIGQYLPDWRPNIDYRQSVSSQKFLGGGALLELSHELDYIQWLMGKMTLQYAQLRSSLELNLEVEELADLVLNSELGTVCNIHLDFLQKQAQRRCSFIGSKGRLDWNLISNTISLHTSRSSEIIYSEPDWDKNQMYLAMVEDFVAQINGEDHHCIDLEQAGATVALIEEIKNQANWGIKQ